LAVLDTSPGKLIEIFDATCLSSVVGTESSFHQLSPYIGKIKSSIASFLIDNFTEIEDTIYDPFCGAGTIPFQGWILGRNVIANDLNSYAIILTKAKLFPPSSIDEVINKIESFDIVVKERKKTIDLRKVPSWVRNFFHKETLREIISWFTLLHENDEQFLTACLLGILHHQRPGFLSFPSSHTVPYLRINKFPREEFPQLYEYRDVKNRLIKKVKRAFKRVPVLQSSASRLCYNNDASILRLNTQVDAIISSPPYMRQLDYARDNRLRLWFLSISDYKTLDTKISPKEDDFLSIMRKCLINWKLILKNGGKCILFLGDNYSKKYKKRLPEVLEQMVIEEVGNYKLIFKHQSIIPTKRRVRRNYRGNNSETILVFEKI